MLTKRQNKRAVSRRASQNKSPNTIKNPELNQVVKFVRTVEGAFDITTTGLVANYGVFNFSLNDLPNYTEFTALFDLYKLEAIEIEWIPEYTELTDAALVSNAVNVYFNSAIDPAGNTPASVDDVLQYRTLHSTSITKLHKRTFVPAYLADGILPVSSYISCASPSTNMYGLVYGVPVTGVAMTFRSRARYHLSLAQAR